jgi:hypothetical protein
MAQKPQKPQMAQMAQKPQKPQMAQMAQMVQITRPQIAQRTPGNAERRMAWRTETGRAQLT